MRSEYTNVITARRVGNTDEETEPLEEDFSKDTSEEEYYESENEDLTP